MTRFILAITLTFSVSPIMSQSLVKQLLDTSADFRGLAVNDQSILASGSKGTFIQSHGLGKTWSVGQVPGCEKLDFRDCELFKNSMTLLSAGPGEASQIWKSTDSGKTWTKQYTNTEPKGFLDAIAFWDESHGLALGDPVDGRFQLLQTTDGKTWSALPKESCPKALDDEGCFAASGTCLIIKDNSAWFVTGGAKVSRAFHSTDRGQTWTSIELPIKAGVASRGAFGMHFRDEKNGIIVGGDYKKPEETNATAAITRDGGKTWTVIDGQLPFCSAVTWTGTRWLATGTQGTYQSEGKTWTQIDQTALNAMQGKWAVGPKGVVMRRETINHE